jgi:rod shape-determining protein MreB
MDFRGMIRKLAGSEGSSLFSSSMAIDLGTANTLVYVEGRGIVLEEPSVIAMENDGGTVVAVGSDAKVMLGRTNRDLTVIRPLKDGVITNATATLAMLREFFARSQTRRFSMRPRVLVCVPSGITEVEKTAVKNSLERAGAREVLMVPEPLASALGVGLPVAGAPGNMIVDIGGGTTEIAVISLNSIVAENSIRVGGDELNESIQSYLKKRFSLLVGERTAESVKITLGAVTEGNTEDMEVSGLDLINGIPRTYRVKSQDILEALTTPVGQIVEAVHQALEKTPAELARDIVDRGIVLSGGGALLRGIDSLLEGETGLPIRIADNPLACTVLGAGIILGDLYRYRKLLLD